MTADRRPEKLEDEFRESVDDAGLLAEPGGGVDHAEYAVPGDDVIQITDRSFQATENRKRRQSGQRVALLNRHLSSDLAQRGCERAIGTLWQMAGDQAPIADASNELKWQHYSGAD